LQQRVEITKQNDRNVRFSARTGNDLQDFLNADPLTQGAFRGPLNHRPIGHWIGERNPQLNQGRARAGEFDDKFERGWEIGIAGRDERYEAFAAFAFEG
jgi:hypothetical protein